jgi:hypothetical protein
MSNKQVETLLAAIYTDHFVLGSFLKRPYDVSIAHGLTDAEAEEMGRLDQAELSLAAKSFRAKRAKKERSRLRSAFGKGLERIWTVFRSVLSF